MINGINKKCFSKTFKTVKVSCFSGSKIDYIYLNLIPLLRKNSATLVLHVGTNNLPNEIPFQIHDKLLDVVHTIKKTPNCHVVSSSLINRLDDGKGAVTIRD